MQIQQYLTLHKMHFESKNYSILLLECWRGAHSNVHNEMLLSRLQYICEPVNK